MIGASMPYTRWNRCYLLLGSRSDNTEDDMIRGFRRNRPGGNKASRPLSPVFLLGCTLSLPL